MSEELIEILKASFERFEREGVPDFDRFDPEIELINFDTFPISRTYHGWDGVVAWLVDISEPFDEFKFDLGEILADDDRHVVTRSRVSGSSRTGGPSFELE